MMELRPKEHQWLASGHSVRMWRSWHILSGARPLMHMDYCPLSAASHSLGTWTAWDLWCDCFLARQDGLPEAQWQWCLLKPVEAQHLLDITGICRPGGHLEVWLPEHRKGRDVCCPETLGDKMTKREDCCVSWFKNKNCLSGRGIRWTQMFTRF